MSIYVNCRCNGYGTRSLVVYSLIIYLVMSVCHHESGSTVNLMKVLAPPARHSTSYDSYREHGTRSWDNCVTGTHFRDGMQLEQDTDTIHDQLSLAGTSLPSLTGSKQHVIAQIFIAIIMNA